MFRVRLVLVVASAAACSKGGADSPHALCEKIHPELVATLTSNGIEVRGDAKAEFVAACETLPVDFLRCHTAPGDGCVEKLGDMELQARLTAPLMARGSRSERPPPPPAEVAEPIVQAIHDRVRAFVVHEAPAPLPDLELKLSGSLCGKDPPDGDARLTLTGTTVSTSLRPDEERKPFPYDRAPGNDGRVIIQMPFLDVKLATTAKVTQRCGARTIEASVPVSLAAVATPDLVIHAVDGSDPLRFEAVLIQPKLTMLIEEPTVRAKGEIERALRSQTLWTLALSDALAAAPATVEAVGRLVEGP